MSTKIFKVFKKMSSEEGTGTESKLKSKPNLESFFINQGVDEKFSSGEFSLDQILKLQPIMLEEIIFKLNVDDFANDRYVTLKVKNFCQHGNQMKLLQVIDVTNYILYTEFKAKN